MFQSMYATKYLSSICSNSQCNLSYFIQVNATDRDSPALSPLTYELESTNIVGAFALDSKTGVLSVVDPSKIQQKSLIKLKVKVMDGKFVSSAHVNLMVC